MISVIVPCFNCEDTIETCCESIIKQTFINIELILVNDGSKDNTASNLEGFKERHPDFNIKIIETENQGVSKARNLGIDYSKGEYIAFVDSDDYIHRNMLEVLYKNIIKESDIDLSVCNFSMEKIDEFGVFRGSKLLESKEMIVSFFQNESVQGFVWNKLYKRNIIKENAILFSSEFRVMEDLDFNLNYMQFVKRAIYDDTQLYYYSIEESQTMFNGLTESKLSVIETYDKMYRYDLEGIRELLDIHYVSYILTLLSNYWGASSNPFGIATKKRLFRELKRKKAFLKKGYLYGFDKYAAYIFFLISPMLFEYLMKKRS